MRTVVLFSGGIGSWAAARRLIDEHGTDGVTLLFTDTLIEDEDTYRFLDDASADLGVPVTTIADGRTPWQVFNDEGMIANTRADLCSRILKRDLARKWVDEHCKPGDTVVMGIDWTEIHRYERAAPRWEPYKLIAPLCDPPYLSKPETIAWAESRGVKAPRLYSMGFPHNNCGGFCVKQGQAAFANLYQQMPDRYNHHAEQEQAFRERTGKDVAILRDRVGGDTKPLTLLSLKERLDAVGDQLTIGDDWGGCGCMVDSAENGVG